MYKRQEEGWVLKIYPRSGLGFKFRLQLNNTVGIIDSDYYGSDNEGHIQIKVTNDGRQGKDVVLEAGTGFALSLIHILDITEQYLDYVSHMDTEDLNIVSEFLVMAATLIEIKAKMLLPAEEGQDGEEEDPRAELVARLLEYKMYKYMAGELKDMEVDAEKLLYREPAVPAEVLRFEEPVDLDQLLDCLLYTS